MSKAKLARIAIAICVCITAALGCNWYCSNSDLPFNVETWKQAGDNDRLRMVHDLKDHRRLIGMSEAAVEGLFGKPREDMKDSIFPPPGFDHIYPLGTKQILPFEEEPVWLLIKFQDGIVTDFEVSG